MAKVNVFEVKAKLSEYLDRASKGERILICRHNQPIAELRAIPESRTDSRPVGPLPGRPTFDVPPTFFEPLSEAELDLWEGAWPTAGSATTGLTGGASKVAESAPEYRVPRARARKRPQR